MNYKNERPGNRGNGHARQEQIEHAHRITCADCQYFQGEPDPVMFDDMREGVCKRHAPRLIQPRAGRWDYDRDIFPLRASCYEGCGDFLHKGHTTTPTDETKPGIHPPGLYSFRVEGVELIGASAVAVVRLAYLDPQGNLIGRGVESFTSASSPVRRREFTDFCHSIGMATPGEAFSLDWAATIGKTGTCRVERRTRNAVTLFHRRGES